jgi:ectoine hydroxylase-related dioxygenase (phytanoyl-CoA dioxygenase family)
MAVPTAQVLRGFLPALAWAVLRQYAEESYTKVGAQLAAGTAHQDFVETQIWGGLVLSHLVAHLGESDAIRQTGRLVEAQFAGARLIETHSVFRRHRDNGTHVGWHTDADAAGCGSFDPCFNVWIPFAPVGRTEPSLELIPDSDPRMRLLPFRPIADNNWPDAWVKATFAAQDVLCPEMVPGDVLVFSHYTLHRTQPLASQTGERTSAEFRFTTA